MSNREIELKVGNINKARVEKALKRNGAKFVKRQLLRRVTFQLGSEGSIKDYAKFHGNDAYHTAWIRVRTDDNVTTLTLKKQVGTSISKRLEYEIVIDNFKKAVKILLELLPNSEYNYIETIREKYVLDGVEITFNKWPLLKWGMEIEAKNAKKANEIYKKLDAGGVPSPSIAVSDREYYRLKGIDYDPLESRFRKKLDRMLSKLD